MTCSHVTGSGGGSYHHYQYPYIPPSKILIVYSMATVELMNKDMLGPAILSFVEKLSSL